MTKTILTARILAFGLLALLVSLPAVAAENNAGAPVRVFILAGQSNMEGKVSVKLLDYQITAPQTAELFAYLHEDGKYITRDDVFIDYLGKRGGLTPTLGGADRYGVEVRFGHVMGDHFDEPVLLIKTAWGGKSIGVDFCPPSKMPDDEALRAELQRINEDNRKRERPEMTLEQLRERYGHYYREMMTHIQANLSEMGQRFPELAGRSYELSGFLWHQGWNDMYNGLELKYEENLEAFIKDVRRDLETPDLPFVIGVMGQNGAEPAKNAMLTVQQAQLAQQTKPAFRGTVTAVRTDVLVDMAAYELFPEWRDRIEEWNRVGSDRPYHYFGSAIWHHRMGQAFADAMLELMGQPQSGE